MTTVIEYINQIRTERMPENQENTTRKYATTSQKQEVFVCNAMMNDTTYEVPVYSGSGYQGVYNPAQSFRRAISSSISHMTGMPRVEADKLVKNYEFTPAEATEILNFSKEFINTYLQTGRKLPLGGRERSNVSLKLKPIEAGFVSYPVKVGEDSNGKPICETKETYVGGYETIKVYGPWPQWCKDNVKNRRT